MYQLFKIIYANFDATEEVTYTIPRFLPSFTRLSDATGDITFEAAGETVWFKIVAMGETITNLALPFRTQGGTSAGMEINLYINNSGAPHSSTTANSGTAEGIETTLPHADFGSAIRCSGVDPKLRIRTSSLSNNASTFNADSTTVPGSATAATEVIHYIKYKTTEGLKVVVFDYIDQAETSGVKYTFNKIKLDSVTPSFANRQATRATVNWKCNDWSFDEI